MRMVVKIQPKKMENEMKDLYPRIICADGISLSVQANKHAYCSPRIDEIECWDQYTLVEVGYITDKNDQTFAPPETWREYADGEFPSCVYGYVPIGLVEAFIDSHNAAAQRDLADADGCESSGGEA
jgi:hypothetical protein